MRIPGVGEDDVVARTVSVATTGCGGPGKAEFEDHVGGCVMRCEFRESQPFKHMNGAPVPQSRARDNLRRLGGAGWLMGTPTFGNRSRVLASLSESRVSPVVGLRAHSL